MAKVIMIHKNSFVSSNVTQPFFCILHVEKRNKQYRKQKSSFVANFTTY